MRVLLWISYLLISVSVILIVAYLVANMMGMETSINLGDPKKYEFILISLWQIGIAGLIPGLAAMFIARRSLRH